MMERYYTVYDRATDDVITTGTAQQCAESMSRSLHSFYTMITRTRSGELQKYVVVIEYGNEIETIGLPEH